MRRFTIEQQRVEEGIHAVVVGGDVDLHAALFDSTTIGVLLAVQRRLGDAGGRLSVLCAAELRTFLAETELDGVLDVQPVGVDAVAALAGARYAAA